MFVAKRNPDKARDFKLNRGGASGESMAYPIKMRLVRP